MARRGKAGILYVLYVSDAGVNPKGSSRSLLGGLTMKNIRYLLKMNSQHVIVRVPWSPAYEKLSDCKAFDAHSDQKLEPVAANLRTNVLQLPLGSDRPLR